MDSAFYKTLQQQAERIVEAAIKILVSHEHSFTIATQKDVIDIATNADLEVEKFIKTEVAKLYPDHGFLGEEFGEEHSDREYVWVIDPLDNTKEYVRGVGEYNCLVAVEHNKEIVVGVTRRMGHEVRYACSKENGSFMDGKQIHVSTTASLDISFIGTNMPNRVNFTKPEIHTYTRLFESIVSEVYRLRPSFDDARTFAWVAQGVLDGVISLPHTNKWVDVASGILLVTEAGGKITDFKGNPIVHHDLSNGLVASNGILHGQLLTIIQKELYGGRI